MMLSEKQITFFQTFGFLKLPGLFAENVQDLTEQFEAVFREHESDVVHWVHETHENRLRRFLPQATEKSTYLASLLDDSRIQGVAISLLGKGYDFCGSDVSIYDCGTTFHQDGTDVSVRQDKLNVKMALYLDEVDQSSGAIRVIPGSHHRGDKFFRVLTQNWLKPETLNMTTEEFPATIVPSSPGDLLLWDYRLMHATAYSGNQRRMLALEFVQGDITEP